MNCYDRQTADFFCLVGKLIGFEEFLNQMVGALGIIIDRRPKGRPRKIEN
ncbi:unnamed protein product [marine sediment metagenome]|uniref:Uncharacterized protein n=1 Tax=marine sediment metagenome TaxID=412755 RepID=X1LNF0_9ZZZZ